MEADKSVTKFVVFVNGRPSEFRDSLEEAKELLRKQQGAGEVREVADAELLCPGCNRNRLLFVDHRDWGGHMTCPECGKVWMS